MISRVRVDERWTGPGAALLLVAAAVASVGNELGRFGSRFLSTGLPGFGEAATGDHLQSVYKLWLVGHQLGRSDAPWIDPYSFQPLIEPQTVFGGLPFGLAFWPLDAAFGPVVAWNVLVVGVTALAGVFAFLWLRALGVGAAGAIAGGLAFELAPYRLAQTGGHLLGWAAVFLPLALWAIERSRGAAGRRVRHVWGALAALSLAAVPLMGQVHLALGAIPFVLLYAAVRFRPVPFAWTAVGAAVSVGGGLLVNHLTIASSKEAGGRPLAEVERYQADWGDLVDRTRDANIERFVDVGWLLPLLALAGFVVLVRRRPGLAVLLGLAAVIPLLLALGTNTPLYGWLRDAVPPFRSPRVPGRLVPIADLALAGLAAFAVAGVGRLRPARAGTRVLLAGLVVLVAADLTVWPLRGSAADPGNTAYTALRDAPGGRILELPVMGEGRGQYGSVYLYYALQASRERPTGYAAAPPEVQPVFAARWDHLDCGAWRAGDRAGLSALGIRYVLLHRGLYRFLGEAPAAWYAWKGLVEHGFRPVATDGAVTLFAPGRSSAPPPGTRPAIRPAC